MIKYLLIILGGIILAFAFPDVVHAKDVIQSVRNAETKVSELLMALGTISLLLSAAAFYFSKQLGSTLLIGSCIGIAIFAGRQGLFDLIYGTFR